MMIPGILLFAVAIFFLSFVLARSGDVDRGKIAAYVTLIGWGSMLIGLLLSKIQNY